MAADIQSKLAEIAHRLELDSVKGNDLSLAFPRLVDLQVPKQAYSEGCSHHQCLACRKRLMHARMVVHGPTGKHMMLGDGCYRKLVGKRDISIPRIRKGKDEPSGPGWGNLLGFASSLPSDYFDYVKLLVTALNRAEQPQSRQEREWNEWMWKLTVIREYSVSKQQFDSRFTDDLMLYMRRTLSLSERQKAAVDNIMSKWHMLEWLAKHGKQVLIEPYPMETYMFDDE